MVAQVMVAVAVVLAVAVNPTVPSFAAEGALPKELTGKDGAPMVLIPAGPFPMGVPPGDRDGGRDEYPRHIVHVDDFYIDKYEVTNGRYLQFVKATNHRVPQNPKNPTRNLWEGAVETEPECEARGHLTRDERARLRAEREHHAQQGADGHEHRGCGQRGEDSGGDGGILHELRMVAAESCRSPDVVRVRQRVSRWTDSTR